MVKGNAYSGIGRNINIRDNGPKSLRPGWSQDQILDVERVRKGHSWWDENLNDGAGGWRHGQPMQPAGMLPFQFNDWLEFGDWWQRKKNMSPPLAPNNPPQIIKPGGEPGFDDPTGEDPSSLLPPNKKKMYYSDPIAWNPYGNRPPSIFPPGGGPLPGEVSAEEADARCKSGEYEFCY